MNSVKEIIKEFNKYHSYQGKDAVLIVELRKKGFQDKHIAAVIKTLNEVCNDCWNQKLPCWCESDDLY